MYLVSFFCTNVLFFLSFFHESFFFFNLSLSFSTFLSFLFVFPILFHTFFLYSSLSLIFFFLPSFFFYLSLSFFDLSFFPIFLFLFPSSIFLSLFSSLFLSGGSPLVIVAKILNCDIVVISLFDLLFSLFFFFFLLRPFFLSLFFLSSTFFSFLRLFLQLSLQFSIFYFPPFFLSFFRLLQSKIFIHTLLFKRFFHSWLTDHSNGFNSHKVPILYLFEKCYFTFYSSLFFHLLLLVSTSLFVCPGLNVILSFHFSVFHLHRNLALF